MLTWHDVSPRNTPYNWPVMLVGWHAAPKHTFQGAPASAPLGRDLLPQLKNNSEMQADRRQAESPAYLRAACAKPPPNTKDILASIPRCPRSSSRPKPSYQGVSSLGSTGLGKEARKANAFIQDKTRSLAHTWLKTELGEEAASFVGALASCIFQAEKGVRSPPPVTRTPPCRPGVSAPSRATPCSSFT